MKKIIAMAVGLVILFSCASASEVETALPFGLKVGDTFDHVADIMTSLLGEGEVEESKISKRITYDPGNINICGLEIGYVYLSGDTYTGEKYDICTILISFDADDLLETKDFSKIFILYDSLCSIMGSPESSSHVITSIDLLGNIKNESIFKRPEEFAKEVSDNFKNQLKETWRNVELTVKIDTFYNSCKINLNIYVAK